MESSGIYIDPGWVKAQVEGLEKRVCALPERAMRHAIIVEFLQGLDPHELVMILAEVNERAQNGLPPSRELLQEFALEPCALATLPYKSIQMAYKLSYEHELPAVIGMFYGEPLRGSESIDERFTGNEHLDLPLGSRRSAARSADRFVLDRVLHDRDHRVIALLLDNPRIVERDVITICARRPQRPEILELVSKHRKWASRYRIRKALACNPYTPHQIGHRLLSSLMMQDIRFLIDNGAVPSTLLEEANRLVKDRRRRFGQPEPDATPYEESREDIVNAANQLLAAFDDVELQMDEEDAVMVNPLEDMPESTEDEIAFLAQMAEMALGESTLTPVSEDDSN